MNQKMCEESESILSKKACSTDHSWIWRQKGYEEFRKGTFGNGGQNIYVSKAGVLQRISRFDFNRDGYTDLLFVNSQDFNERPPIHVVNDPLGDSRTVELPTLGTYAAAMADLNGDGYDDLVLANQCNGTHSDITAYIYYGSPEGLSERYKIELPVPDARGVAIGDFNGDGRPDIAFASDSKLRIFYQGENGFVPGEYIDLDFDITHLASSDLDGDGYDELYVRVRNRNPLVLWGGSDGIQADRYTNIGGDDPDSGSIGGSSPNWATFEEGWTTRILLIDDKPYLFRAEDNCAVFYPVDNHRNIGAPISLECKNAVSAAVGDINADGHKDIVVAVCENRSAAEKSVVYWGSADGFSDDRKAELSTVSARDVIVADLTGDGFGDVVICQGRTDVMHTTESLVFRGCAEGLDTEPVRFVTYDATQALAGRTSDDVNPQLIFINHVKGHVRGDIPAYIYHNGPDGFSESNREELPGWSAPDALCTDFNDNGWPDILICNCAEDAIATAGLNPGSFLYWGGPDGFHTDRRLDIPSSRAHGSAVGDFGHTGHLDLIIGGWANPELLLFKGGATGLDVDHPEHIILDKRAVDCYTDVTSFSEWSRGDLSETRWLLSADFNNDGWLDLFVSQIYGPYSLILWGGPDGFSMDRSTRLYVEGSSCAQAADLTGNGWLDLIVGGHQSRSKKWRYDSYVYIYWGGPDGFSESRRTQLPAHTCNSLAVADFNNDGILDIFASSYNAGRDRDCDSYIYWGAPGGIYSVENRTRLFGHSACGCIAADFNEDGWVDLAVAHHKTYGSHPGYSKIWWNGPDGFSEKHVTKLPTMGPHGMIQGDPGNIMDRSAEEFYESAPYELPDDVLLSCVYWEAEIQPKTWVRAQIRVAERKDELCKSVWKGPDGADTWFENGDCMGISCKGTNWIQYRLALGAVNSGNSPRLTEISIEYTGCSIDQSVSEATECACCQPAYS